MATKTRERESDSRLQVGRRWAGSRCGHVSVDTYWGVWPDKPVQRHEYTPGCLCLQKIDTKIDLGNSATLYRIIFTRHVGEHENAFVKVKGQKVVPEEL